MPLPVFFARPIRFVAALAGGAAVVVGASASAGAHVTVQPEVASAGSYTVLTFAVPHGCDTSSTTDVVIEIPEEILAVTPTVNPNWDVVKLAADGSTADGAPVAQVVYSARTPLPHDLRDTFELSVRLPDDAGQTLAFPVVQGCEEGEAAWVEVAAADADPHDLEYPAPLVEVTEPAADGHGGGVAHEHEEARAAESGTDAMSMAGFGTGVAGVVLGGAALLYARRRTHAGR
jgi:uncharacterized protein YcnI